MPGKVVDRWVAAVTAAATALFWMLVCEGRPWRLFAVGGYSSDFYDVQARSFWHAQLAVPADVATIEGFRIGDDTYLYFGPMLAVLRMPFVALVPGIDGRLSRLSMIVGFAVLCAVTGSLVRRVGQLIGVEVSGRRRALVVAAVACSPVMALAGRTAVYYETELWAFTLMMCALVALIDVMLAPSQRTALVAAATAGATLLTRVTVGVGAVVAVVIVAAVVWRHGQRAVAATAVGGVCVAVGVHGALNLAKFGHPILVPPDRQVLSLVDASRAAWFDGNGNSFFGARFVPTTTWHYLRPDAFDVERLIPFIRFGPRAHEFGSYPLEGNTPSSSLTVAATLLVVLAAVGAVVTVRDRARHVVALLVGCVGAAAPTLAFGHVANRYLVDLLPGLVVLAAVAVARVEVRAPRRAAPFVIVLLVWGTAANTAFAVWGAGLEQPGFTLARYAVDDRLFGGRPPSTIRIDPLDPRPRDGVVGIDGACDGLYVSSGQRWIPVELAGSRHVRGEFQPADGGAAFVDESGSGIVIDVFDDGRIVVSEVPGDPTAIVEAFVWTGGAVTVDIVSDPTADWVRHGLQVSLDGSSAYIDFGRAPDLSAMHPSPALTLDDADAQTPLCERLLERSEVP